MADWEKGKITVRRGKKGNIHARIDYVRSGKNKHLESFPDFIFSEDMNGKEAEFQMESGQIINIRIDGKEVQRKNKPDQVKTHNSSQSNRQGSQRTTSEPLQEIYISRPAICNIKCPSDTKLLMHQIDNFGLGLQKFLMFDNTYKPFKFVELDSKTGRPKEDISQIPNTKIRVKMPDTLISSLSKRSEEIRQGMEKNGFKVNSFVYKPLWRFVIGLGGESVYETSITLHHIYGFPYIPGSAIKGITRSWVICNEFDNNEEKALEDARFVNIFGNQDQRGKIIFMDAFPVEKPIIEVDIMNPHYSDYYSGEEPPADYLSPIPVQFLTVTETKFKFTLASKDDRLLEIASKNLKEGLSNHGIGAKTSVGYGYFDVTS